MRLFEPKFNKVFCPPPENILSKGFNNIIDSGKIVAVNMPLGTWGNVGRTISIMLKLDFHRGHPLTSLKSRKRPLNQHREAPFHDDR